MKEARKNITVTLPAELVAEFQQMKEKAENELMMKLSDAQYASRLMIWAISKKKD